MAVIAPIAAYAAGARRSAEAQEEYKKHNIDLSNIKLPPHIDPELSSSLNGWKENYRGYELKFIPDMTDKSLRIYTTIKDKQDKEKIISLGRPVYKYISLKEQVNSIISDFKGCIDTIEALKEALPEYKISSSFLNNEPITVIERVK